VSTLNPTTTKFTDKAEALDVGFTQSSGRQHLAEWIMEFVTEWEDWRKKHFDTRWGEYIRKWRGIWDEGDRTRKSERSRLISPALQEAIEEAVAEWEEATIGSKEAWFDMDDDASDAEQEDWQDIRKQLLDDMHFANVSGSMVECALMGALYGTLIGKVVVEEKEDPHLAQAVDPNKPDTVIDGVEEEERVTVRLEPVKPTEFVIDTAVNKPGKEGIEMAMGMAHRLPRPRHIIRAKQNDAILNSKGGVDVAPTYWEAPLGDRSSTDLSVSSEDRNLAEGDTVLITEYHGLVPRALLDAAIEDGESDGEIDTTDMVEAIVTLADDKYALRAVENEKLKRDRDFIAAPWDLIPGSFWGRGVAEKGFNAQKALDAMLRAQLDGIAFTVHPMMGVDGRRRDPRQRIEVAPGKVLIGNGNPQEIFTPMRFGNIDPASLTMSGELERLIRMGTGTSGTQAPIRTNRSNETLGGQSIIKGDIAKRSKRTLRLTERHFLLPLVEKMTLRYMEFDEEVYPFVDLKFRVRTTLSMVAREVENTQLSNLLQVVPPQSPVFFALLGQIIDNSSLKDKGMVTKLIGQVVQQLSQQGDGTGEDKEQPDEIDQMRKVVDADEVKSRADLKRAQRAKILAETEDIMRGKPSNERKPKPKGGGKDR